MKEIFEKLYKEQKSTWTSCNPPKELVECIKKNTLPGRQVIDVGCGEGYFSLYLSRIGFDALGIDFSEVAIERAREHARREGTRCRFMTADVFNLKEMKERFDFVLEWGLLHLIPPQERVKYISGIHNVLGPGGYYLSASLSDKDDARGMAGIKYRLGPASGLWLYYSTQNELNSLFSKFFYVVDSKLIHLYPNTAWNPLGNYLLMKKRSGEVS